MTTMKTHTFRFVAALFALMLAASLQSVQAQTSYTLIVEGIQGDGTSSDATLLATGWSFGASNAGSGTGGGGGGAGRASFEELVVNKTVDAASPLLMKACASGQHIPTAVLKGTRKGAKQEYLLIKMSNVVISSVNVGGISGKPAPTESVSFTFSKIEYFVRKKSGEEVKFTWNLETGSSS